MNGEVAGTFIYNGVPQNGATAQLWKITGFATYADSTDEVENNPLAATDIELTVNAGGTFAIGDVIRMATEVCRITHIDTNKLYIIRGYRGTTPAIHAQNVQIDDETITEPAQDTAVPAGSQQGGDVTTGVAYGGDGAYRWTAVPEGEYYVSVSYDSHIAWLYVFVENNDPTPEQLLRLKGDMPYFDGEAVTRLEIVAGRYMGETGGIPAWVAGTLGNKEFFAPVIAYTGNSNLTSFVGDFGGVVLEANGYTAFISFFVPNDFTAITDAVIVGIAKDTLNADAFDILVDYAADDEAYNTNSDSDEASTYSETQNDIFEWDISGLLGALAIADYVGVNVHNDGDTSQDVLILGVRFKYS